VIDFETGIESSVLAASLLALTGVLAGLSGGFWGIGAGWMVVPVLILLGVDPAVAVGCCVFHMVLKSVYPTAMRWRQMDWRRGGPARRIGLPITAVGMIFVIIGVLALEKAKGAGSAAIAVGLAYVVLLLAISVRSMLGFFHHRNPNRPPERGPGKLAGILGATLVGVIGGMLSGFLGVGGSFLGRPALRYILHLPETSTAAICQFTVLGVSIVGALAHGLKGNIHWPVAVSLTLGGVVGQWLGTLAHGRAHGPGKEDWAAATFGLAAFGVLLVQVFGLLQLQVVGQIWTAVLGVAIAGLIIFVTFREPTRITTGPAGSDSESEG